MHKLEVFEYKLFMTSRARGLASRFSSDSVGSFPSTGKYDIKYKRLRLMIIIDSEFNIFLFSTMACIASLQIGLPTLGSDCLVM